ncbi:MFS transporter [Microbacterium sp. CFBP9023]|uniref:MFS transporter n=1 Tax=Microbacterium sp. CFBP9023 TaxID=3096535 RepID=UPI002A6AB8A0|nr:MFS transporter [Microbacterium sp. CFBP9023]MDY0984975.1 MFS transporter [Microbacterium sp. CFBP9023]
MKRWNVVIVLGSAQFVMVLDGTVMNVSISTVVDDLDTTVAAMQGAITFYTLTMAAFMLLGAKLGDVWGRRRAFVIGSCVYAVGSLVTAVSPNVQTLFLGWSVIEGLGAVLVIPAIAALVADNYQGRERVTAFAVIGAVSGAAVAAGPLIGGFVTTYFDWRYVFAAEVVIMVGVVLCARIITDATERVRIRIDLLSVALSSAGLVAVVFGMLQSKVWGWIVPLRIPVIGGVPVAPLGISLAAWLIVVGVLLVALFIARQRMLVRVGRQPLVTVEMFRISSLRSGLSVLGAQYAVTAGLFFMVPVYLQMTLGLDALQTGIRIFPLSVALVLFSIVGTALTKRMSPRTIVRIGQLLLVFSALVLLGSATSDLRSGLFAVGMFLSGAALGLLASQLGNVNMSSVSAKETSEVGGLQGVFQNLGSSLGTALIGSILIGALSTSFASGVAASDLSATTRASVAASTEHGVTIVPASAVPAIAEEAGLSADDAEALAEIYRESQLSSLRVAFFGLIVISLLALFFSRGIPQEIEVRRRREDRVVDG